MKIIRVGEIFSICVPSDTVCAKHADQDYIEVNFWNPHHKMRLFLFQRIGEDCLKWCYMALDEHIRECVGPPFQTSVQQVAGETWLGYQAVTAIQESQFLVNRVIASRVSDSGVRIEFNATRDEMPEALMAAIESIMFNDSTL